ncbi:MAG: HEAT repeat domain-containing protein [Hylemonella sp.]|nr:HEAT repeat domain-containing protein [Hylemonella sp.]
MALSLNSLVGMALQDWRSDESWKAISELQMRGSPEALALVRRLAKSRNPRKRALGLYIASQLRQRQKGDPFRSIEYALEDTQELLLAGLHDICRDVLHAAISGAGHRPHPLALPELVKFASHPDQEIRFGVAVALGRYSEAGSIDALLRLARDDSDAVRDWATFGIGTMQEVDDQKIRDLLWVNLQDKDEDVRGEALVGLAIRKDERIIPVLLKQLETNCRVYELTASESTANPQLLERLNTIKDSVTNDVSIDSYWYGCLLDAIDACSKKE